ncbi:DUF1659 domain-containing protein [Bacillus sp. MUM 13]|uniref:DUF1659 domain-containing protein n=1 Tax=Bacillus sp. MUM 13 TaxID=1678001 RepID=UPI0008F5BFAD|nr:DUF1659 domain-containing protein [Bacillus sp. MUM 13]OIK14522.1 hypothetical protein BIV59_03030 [Bacillus sp. MUM 13]
MANGVLYSSTLKLSFDTGMNEKGEAVLKRKSYANIKTQSTAAELFSAAKLIASLQVNPLQEVVREDAASLHE